MCIRDRAVCEQLGGWPLALRIAGHYLRSTGESAAEYLRWLEKEPLKELGDGEHQDENAALLLRRSVAQVSDDARLALGVTGTLAFAPINIEPVIVVLSGASLLKSQGFLAKLKVVFTKNKKPPFQYSEEGEHRSRLALNELVNYGLLEKLEKSWQISHSLIHTYARTELPLSRDLLKQLSAFYIAFCHTLSEAELEGYAFLDKERTHCLRLIEICLDSKLWQEMQALTKSITTYLDRRGYWTDMLAAFVMNLNAAFQTGDLMAQVWCLNNLGYTCHQQGEREQALRWYESSLLICRKQGNRPEEGSILSNVAIIGQEVGQYELAMNMYKQSLSINREIGNREGEGVTLHNIAGIYYAIEDYEQALTYYEQCLSIWQELDYKCELGVESQSIISVL